jgi:predicted dehydrogenase
MSYPQNCDTEVTIKMKIAFAGTGYINKVHARAAKNCRATLAAVVNHKAETMAAFAEAFGIDRQYASVEALLEDGNVDALIIGTPNYLHAPQAIAALNAGVHVMVEKPMAMNAQEAEQMCAEARKSGATLMVAHCWRFDPEVLWLKEHSKELGMIIRTKGIGVHARWGPAGWFTQKQLAGGGALADMGIHALDTARFLLGDPQPVSVFAKIDTHYGNYDVDDTGVIIVTWENGATSYIESGWWQPHADGPEAATQLYGKEGFGSLFPTLVKVVDQDTQKMNSIESGFTFPREQHCPQGLYDAQMKYFIECIEKKQAPSPGGMDGLANMKVVDAAYESARTGEVVRIV